MREAGPGLRRRVVLFRHEADMNAVMQTLTCRGIMQSVPLPLVHGALCLCDPDGERTIRASAHVARVEPDAPVRLKSHPLWSTDRRGKRPELPQGIRAIRAPAAWNQSQGEGVNVAIFDTGAALFHPALAPNLADGLNLVSPGTPPQDDNGHGTHVAGIIGAADWNSGGVGVAPSARLRPVKVLDADGDGRLSDVLLGLQWVVDQQVPVVNMSLDILEHAEAMELAVKNAVASGVVIIAATGNKGATGSISYPALYPDVLSVGAVGPDRKLAHFSCTGSRVDLVAPGVSIRSTSWYGRYSRASGTSMASPHVAGVVALYLALYPTATPVQVKRALKRSAIPLPGLGSDQQGAGIVDALNAIHFPPDG